jgi:hypothetical protein
MSIQPEGEALRKATKWISEQRKYHPGKRSDELVEAACLKFNLTPKEAEFLSRFLKENPA